MNKLYSIMIGIDPGVKTGFAVYDKAKRTLISVESNKMLTCLHIVNELRKEPKNYPLFIRFEDARQRTWIPRQKNEKAERGRAQGAGSVKRDCQIWEDFCRMHGIDFEAVPPRNNKTKMTAEAFERMTGWKGRTNEHGRDAAMLVYGL